MPFPPNVREEALLCCKRYCCICERYRGVKVEVHHIVQESKDGPNIIDNAIPLCFDCHAEVRSYSPEHPKGNKYAVGELKRIRDSFYEKVVDMPRKTSFSERDAALLDALKNDITEIMEYIIDTDLASQPVLMDLSYDIEQACHKWNKKRNCFDSYNIENLKIDIISLLCRLNTILTPEYFHYHKGTNYILFNNDSWEAGCKLRDFLQPESYQIRLECSRLLETLYSI